MKRFSYIKSFTFSKADYVLGDRRGNIAIIKINYRKNEFRIVKHKMNGKGYSKLQKEAKSIAKDLLRRKSKINFAREHKKPFLQGGR